MSQAPAYTRSNDFVEDEAANAGGRSTVKTAQINAEFDAAAASINALRANVALNQRDDGEIRDSRVKLHTLASDVLAMLTTLGATPRGAWVTATAYALKDLVSQSGNTYIAVSAHTSGVFATDLAAGKWLLFSLSAAPSASQVTFAPTGTIASTDIQSALNEADTENRALSAAASASAAAASALATANDAALRAAVASTTSGSDGATLVGTNSGETGEVGRTLHFWVKASRRNLCNFLLTTEVDDILSRTASIDISTKFNTALLRASGGILELPEGDIRAEGLTVAGSRTIIAGQGLATRIRAPSAASNVITVSTGDYIEIRDLMIDALVARSGGRYIDIASPVTRFRLSGFYFDGFYEAIRTLGSATIDIEHGKLANGIAASGIGIRVGAGFDVSIRDIVMDAAAQVFAGIYVTATGDLTIEDCNIIHGGQALYLNPGAGQVVASVWANNSFFDTSSRGLYVNPNGAGASVVRCIADECWFGGATGAGVQFVTAAGGTVNGFDFNGCHVFNNGSDGINIADTGTTNVSVDGGAFAGNVGAAFAVGANVSEWSVRNARMGSTHGLTANGYGVFVSAGTSANFAIENNDLRGNTTAAISDSGTGAGKLIADNIGWGYGVSVAYNPPNLADGAGVTTTVTVTGAVLGDFVTASFSQDLQGITLTAWVSAANTVSVRFQNESGGALDLIAGDLRAVIERKT